MSRCTPSLLCLHDLSPPPCQPDHTCCAFSFFYSQYRFYSQHRNTLPAPTCCSCSYHPLNTESNVPPPLLTCRTRWSVVCGSGGMPASHIASSSTIACSTAHTAQHTQHSTHSTHSTAHTAQHTQHSTACHTTHTCETGLDPPHNVLQTKNALPAPTLQHKRSTLRDVKQTNFQHTHMPGMG
jgi:hypothetical protein